MKRSAFALCLAVSVAAPSAAMAYVGPGAGLSLLGALWALVAAVAVALFFVVAWPVRKLLKRRRPDAADNSPSGQPTRAEVRANTTR
jgi:hypothetical protein